MSAKVSVTTQTTTQVHFEGGFVEHVTSAHPSFVIHKHTMARGISMIAFDLHKLPALIEALQELQKQIK